LMRDDADWLDDVRIEGGRVSIVRWHGVEDYDDDTGPFDAIVELCPDDEAWRAFAQAEHTRAAERQLLQAAHASQGEESRRKLVEEARRRLARPGSSPRADAVSALADMLVGSAKAAAERGRRAQGEARAEFVLALIALGEGRRGDAQAHASRATSRAAWMCEAHLIALASGAAHRQEHERALVGRAHEHATAYPGHTGGPWSALRLALLVETGPDAALDDALLRAADTAHGEERKGAALLLFTWGEALRLRASHAKSGEARRALATRARPFFERARELDPLGGEIARREAWLKG
jgi:hypothetical protein